MGRPRGFKEEEVLDAAALAFVRGGYEGTSVDDLVIAVHLHRGSLYKAFGSKRGLFLAALRHHVGTRLTKVGGAVSEHGGASGAGEVLVRGPDLDLLLVAALERGPRDPQVAAVVREGLALIEAASPAPGERRPRPPGSEPRPEGALQLLGARLYERLHDPSADTASR